MTYQLICGAEIHVELGTKSGMFCGCPNNAFHAAKPNIYTCPVCLGLPGSLPVPNKQAIEWTILLGLALNCEIASESKFDRKHYFYPDLPKGYQISQYDMPLCRNGYIETSQGRVGITRVHLEEDTATLKHTVVDGKRVSLIDFNRSGTPLAEIVTEPDIKSPEHAKEVLKTIRGIVRSLGISDADMEKGQMRLEANISLTKDGSLPNYKVEVKNINSFRFFCNALEYEFKRQAEILDKGEVPKQETRGYRAYSNSTSPQRGKEEASDYRYMPEPDIPPLIISREMVERIRANLTVLPSAKIDALVSLGIVESAAKIIANNQVMMDYIDQVKALNPKYVQQVAKDLVNKKLDFAQVAPTDYIKTLESRSADKITDASILTPIIQKLLGDNPTVVADYQAGKQNAIGFFVGAVMRATKGKADPVIASSLLKSLL